ncbi:F390 synthetase-related protein [Deinococcus altitudinis]|uniref:F390 synthetase-related protein n=1 Tax=Deinococcus altitudinis TaxID=468914 RepID=UPI003892B96B
MIPDGLLVLRSAFAESRLMFRDRDRLERYAAGQAAAQMRWLAVHSPYTAQRLREAELSPLEWRSLPPIGKAEMMGHFDTLNTAGLRLEDVLAVARRAESSRDFTPTLPGPAGPVTVGLSSGTSGTQGAFLVSRAERLQWAGVILRRLLPPPWPAALLKRQRVAFLLRAEGGLYRSVQGRRIDFRFFDLLRPVSELAAGLSAYRPTLLIGPPSVLRALLTAGAAAAPERVVAVAEVLEQVDRALLEAGFGPVVQVYQATEGLLALPCPHGHLHLNEAHVHFDWEDLGGGYLRPVITDLRRRTQPVVRHRLDDLLVLGGGCTCGLAARRVERIAGRQDDALLLPGAAGESVTVWPDFIRGAMNLLAGLREYRAEQTGADTLRLSLDPDTGEGRASAEREVRAALRRCGADADRVRLEFVPLAAPDADAPVPRAKRRRVARLWTP